ncbi:MAG: S8 family serine peptidase [Alphaproteobacteria bacterium]|nr:S8 family serine peptidase [Alphaproteobacteria bacterium]
MPNVTLPNSTYLDFNSYRSGAAPLSGGTPVTSLTMNVALVMDRANDPTALLNANWGSRQQQLQALNDSGSLWSTYGANTTNYDDVLKELKTLGIKTVNEVDPKNGYVSSPESRTIWVQLNETDFSNLFGTTLMEGTTPTGDKTPFWNGSLSLPDTLVNLGVQGLWFDSDKFNNVLPNPGSGAAASLPQGPQSLGNSSTSATDLFPQQIANGYYDFPLSGTVPTGKIGLVEPGVGTEVPAGKFDDLLNKYRREAGITTPATVITVDRGGQKYVAPDPGQFSAAGERSLDVGVVTAIAPQSPMVVYAGSGNMVGAQSNGFTAYQSAFWDTVNNPEVVTSSFGYNSQSAPGSPWSFTTSQLFIDAALRNITVFNAVGDGGSGDMFGNGLTNVPVGRDSPFSIMVGGTSLATMRSALADATLAQITSRALAADPTTLWLLIAGGLTALPDAGNGGADLVETVWNGYVLNGTTIAHGAFGTGYIHNNTGSGGVDSTQAVPSYQQDFGLTPTTSDPQHLTGRGMPDVSANAGGDMFYRVPGPDMQDIQNDDGTSAATPLWAALTAQFNAIFHDQGLPSLGYMDDLLYTADAVAPASFDDPQLGNDTSSFTYGGAFISDGRAITPTGYGYSAGPGYDLATGLGTPNGLLLARTLTALAHAEMFFANEPEVVTQTASGGWQSGARQTLLVQTALFNGGTVTVNAGAGSLTLSSGATGQFAWTSQFAEQVEQSFFDGGLVRLFDKAPQGALGQIDVNAGDPLSININGVAASGLAPLLTSASGFADFQTADGTVRLARPVAIAETADGGNDEEAIVRARQDGTDSTSVLFYRTDDFAGDIGTLRPGDPGYAAAAASRAYQLASGGIWLGSPGNGNYEQTMLEHVNAGDLIAMELVNNTHGNTYWAFAQANEMVGGQNVGHLWNYGMNTWGWEDTFGGGDRDYNDFTVQFDFTSNAGHGWIK